MRILYNAIAFKLWGGEEHIERERGDVDGVNGLKDKREGLIMCVFFTTK